ncbi:MAG: GGDEF domain-containing protein [Desulfotignum sp.]|nr:GGDEF domain-containing protein [Desulfobacteraceae bacterium]
MGFQRQKLSRRVVSDLKKRSTSGVFFYMLVPPILFFTDNYIQRHVTVSLVFLGVFFVICLFRLAHVYVSKKISDRYESLNTGIFIFSILLTALSWGVGSAYILHQSGEQAMHSIMLICTVGFCAGGVMSFMPLLQLAVAYNLLMLVPAISAIFLRGDTHTLGFAMILYSVYLVLITLRGNHEYWTAMENEHLLEEKSRELKKASRTDALTGLYNRRYFDELFDLEWGLSGRRKTPLTLLMCDIDHFKKVNDTHGHQAGDEYLKLVSQYLRSVFQRDTDLVARYGGEEFVVLLPDRGADQALSLAEQFRKKIADAVLEYNNQNIRTTISLGIASCTPGSDMNRDRLITLADNALYAAKDAGRNRVVVDTP